MIDLTQPDLLQVPTQKFFRGKDNCIFNQNFIKINTQVFINLKNIGLKVLFKNIFLKDQVGVPALIFIH